jgi:hypothetical protein
MLAQKLLGAREKRLPQIISSQFSERTTTGTAFDVTMPSGIQAGDLLLVVYVTELLTDGTRATPPSGWTKVLDSIGRSLNWKIAGASEPSNYTFTYTANTRFSGFALCIRNADFDVVGTIGQNANPNVAPSITVSENESILFSHNGNGATASVAWTAPSGFSPLITDSNETQPSSALFYQESVSAGSTGTVSATPSTGNGRGFLFSVKPA